MSEINKLRPLRDLTQLTIAENPVTQIPHCRAYIIFILRTLSTLDGQNIAQQERDSADSRFAQGIAY